MGLLKYSLKGLKVIAQFATNPLEALLDLGVTISDEADFKKVLRTIDQLESKQFRLEGHYSSLDQRITEILIDMPGMVSSEVDRKLDQVYQFQERNRLLIPSWTLPDGVMNDLESRLYGVKPVSLDRNVKFGPDSINIFASKNNKPVVYEVPFQQLMLLIDKNKREAAKKSEAKTIPYSRSQSDLVITPEPVRPKPYTPPVSKPLLSIDYWDDLDAQTEKGITKITDKDRAELARAATSVYGKKPSTLLSPATLDYVSKGGAIDYLSSDPNKNKGKILDLKLNYDLSHEDQMELSRALSSNVVNSDSLTDKLVQRIAQKYERKPNEYLFLYRADRPKGFFNNIKRSVGGMLESLGDLADGYLPGTNPNKKPKH